MDIAEAYELLQLLKALLKRPPGEQILVVDRWVRGSSVRHWLADASAALCFAALDYTEQGLAALAYTEREPVGLGFVGLGLVGLGLVGLEPVGLEPVELLVHNQNYHQVEVIDTEIVPLWEH